MSGLVDRLVEHGMVQRSDDPVDRRIRRLSVTDLGGASLRSLVSNQNTMPSQVLERLADDDLRALVQGLVALDRVLEELSTT
jgi:DNA-binding MarR family transcriptional regulator